VNPEAPITTTPTSTPPPAGFVPTLPDAGTPTRMPWFALVSLAAMGFILVAAETMPAGLLPVIARDLGTSEGLVGQFISVWALGTVIVTIPALALTRGLRRKPLLVGTVIGLVLANTVTVFAGDVVVALVSRFVAGAFCGVIWGMLAAYGRRISPPDRGGLALSIVSIGAPAGLALGTPLGAWLGTAFDWRWAFGGLTALALVVLVLITVVVPDAPGQPRGARLPVAHVFRLPGVAIVLAVIVVWMLAHNTVYTYIAPFLRASGTGLGADLVLLVYGFASIAGIGLTAALIDRHPRALLHGSITVFVVAAALLLLGHASVVVVVVATVLWGLAFGGSSAQLQSALTRSGREHSDVANSFLPVAFNLAIFAGGVLGALLLGPFDGLILPVVMIALGCAALLLTIVGRPLAESAQHARSGRV